jgi:hypothetical protein
MNNKEVPMVVFAASIILAVLAAHHFYPSYLDAWNASPQSAALFKYSAVMLVGGYILASLAICSWHAIRNQGYYAVFDASYAGPIIGPAVAAIVVSIAVTLIIWLGMLITPWHINVAKTWTIVGIIVEILMLIVQYLWLSDEIETELEEVD